MNSFAYLATLNEESIEDYTIINSQLVDCCNEHRVDAG